MGRAVSERERALLQMRGIPSHTPAEPIRAHILRLRGYGMTDAMIARAAGIANQTVANIRTGEFVTVRIRHAAAVMRVTHTPDASQAYVLSVGAVRRVQALRASGWPMDQIASRVGVAAETLYQNCTRPTITYARWRQVVDVYEELSATPGGNKQAADHARRRRWYLPMEWHGYDIDDPRVTPKRARRDARAAAAAARLERVELIHELTRAGVSAAEIAERVGVDKRTVVRFRSKVAA
jgi:DNA-binding CsgD family transcriptional regulator